MMRNETVPRLKPYENFKSMQEESLSKGLTTYTGLGRLSLRRPAKALIFGMIKLGLPRVVPRVVMALPHDVRAFTQGLAYHDKYLYESSGGYGNSSLRRIDPRTGHIQSQVSVPGDFAEGIAVIDGRLFQLSWESGKARVYSLPDLEKIDELSYEGEGWGLATGPGCLVMSDGSSVLRLQDKLFQILGERRVRSHGIPVWNINDVEFCRGRLYANILGSTDLFEISLANGQVGRIVDCSCLSAMAGPPAPYSVLNGIAYNPDEGTFFLTGKNWSTLFEVEIEPTEK